METSSLGNILQDFENLTKNPEYFLSKEDDIFNKSKKLVKETYDFTKKEESKVVQNNNTLPELIVKEFDIEQIWQQVDLQNEDFLNGKIRTVSDFVINKDNLLFLDIPLEDISDNKLNCTGTVDNLKGTSVDEKYEKQNIDQTSGSETETEEDGISESGLDDSDSVSRSDKNEEKRSSVVDDNFFKLKEMEDFLNLEEKKLNTNHTTKEDIDDNSSEESIDLFKSEETEDDESSLKNPRFKDFFRKPGSEVKNTKRNKFLSEIEQSEDEVGSGNKNINQQKSTFEIRQERLKQKIDEIEETALSEKPWTLKGEVTAEKRPPNSLLEEILEFDVVRRPPPVITEETTRALEDIIIQRIKDKAFDDVERKTKLVETPFEYKKRLVLEQEKSKESLAQIYEKEYLQQKEALNANPLDINEEEPELHKAIRKMMKELFAQLNALSNFHFTPKTPAPELKVLTNLPAISMEEVAPLTISDAALLAPEEIKPKPKGEIIGKEERTATDKKRARRKKKLKQKKHKKEKEKRDKLNPILNKQRPLKDLKDIKKITKHRNTDRMLETKGAKALKSSRGFFEQLQEQVSSHIKSKKKEKRSKNKQIVNAKKVKL